MTDGKMQWVKIQKDRHTKKYRPIQGRKIILKDANERQMEVIRSKISELSRHFKFLGRRGTKSIFIITGVKVGLDEQA